MRTNYFKMPWTGKIIGFIVGGLLLGPIGMLCGLIIGHFYDLGLFEIWFKSIGIFRHIHQQHHIQQVFFNATFLTMGYIAKADGYVSAQEILAAEKIMHQMSLTSQLRDRAIDLFNLGKQNDSNIIAALAELKQVCRNFDNLLHKFIEIQIYMAMANGSLSQPNKSALQFICHQLEINSFDFERFEEEHRTFHNYQRQQTSHYFDRPSQLENAYNLLGVSATHSNAEIKNTYRRLMNHHHPDKLIAKGLPPQMIELATQKTQQIRHAYEIIKKEKGFN